MADAAADDEVGSLYGLPLEEFTDARNRLAARLKKEGDAEGADRVRKLAKPSVPAWTINQLARKERGDVEALLEAGARVREAQAAALGGGAADAVPAAERELRDRVQRLTRAARAVLSDAGRSSSAATVDRIATSLRAAALDPGARERLARGELTEDVEPTGFEALLGVTPSQAPTKAGSKAAAKPAAGREKREAERRREIETRRVELDEARTRQKGAREALKRAERQIRDAERAVERAQKEHERALADAEAASEQVAGAEAAFRQAKER